ncbi:hypothetical protein MOE90_20605 [Bacillus spizizenii]|nr:hypothetical protein [Bacillus spizizenii]MCY9124901.1 hypothetical protein [Bacillus spizizenii]
MTTQQQNFIQGNVVMNSESANDLLADYATLHLQPIRRLHVTIEVLNDDNETIEVLQGKSTAGNINNEGTSLMRRTGNLTLVLFDYLLPNQASLLWMTNKIRVYAGIDNLRSTDATPTHFCLGTFYITEPNVSISRDNRTISISLEDRMSKWSEEQFENKLIIEAETPVSVAVKSILSVAGETNIDHIEESDLLVPYQIEFAQGSTVEDALKKILDLYMDWEAYYNTEGNFVYQKMTMQYDRDLTPAWTFPEDSQLLLTFNENYTYKGVKNRIVVFGTMDETTGITPRSQADLVPSLTFGADNIGIRKKVIVESSYIKKEQCESKAKFELWKASTLQEKVSITCVPIYFLDSNDIIELWNPATKETVRYSISSINFGLGVNDTMQIQATKVYYDDVILDAHDAQVDHIIDMITNKGWLSIPEARIKQYYGLEGDGASLVVNFEYNESGGTTAYVTGYLGTTTQTLTIDLVDLGGSVGDNGDSGLPSKGDYADRIIGHEMVHAVMNNQCGMAKMDKAPVWFTEGSAEFIHGADERVKASIVEDGRINDEYLDYMIKRGVSVLKNESWNADSDDYSASYVIMKYIDKKITAGKDMRSFMATFKNSTSDGLTAVKEAIVANTGYSTFDEFVSDFEANGANFVKTKMTLNLDGDEVDTGSIGGSDHRGTKPLNAEDIFDESLAEAGVIAKGFKVTFERP